MFMGCFFYGITMRTPESFMVTLIGAIVGTGLLFINDKVNKRPKSEA
jgi:hypothetical protein